MPFSHTAVFGAMVTVPCAKSAGTSKATTDCVSPNESGSDGTDVAASDGLYSLPAASFNVYADAGVTHVAYPSVRSFTLKEFLTEAIVTHRALGDARWEAVSGRELAIVHQDEGNHAAAVELLTASREALRDVGDGRREGATLRCLAWVALEAGDLPEALAYARQARETLSRTRDTHGLAGTEVLLGDIHLALGNPATGRAHLDRGVAYLDSSGDPRWRGKSMISLGRHLAAAGNYPGARAAWEEAWEDLSRIGAHEAATVRALLDG